MTGRPLEKARLAEQVEHGRRAQQVGLAQRQAGDGAQVLLELVGDAGLDGVVAGVVGARRDLVDQQLAGLGQEHLDAEDADAHQRLDRLARRAAGGLGVVASMRAGASSMSRMFSSGRMHISTGG
jgi:hypothetical protein